MKIIFDSEEQKNTLFRLLPMDYCPSILGLKDITYNNCDDYACNKCWENCGIEVEVIE